MLESFLEILSKGLFCKKNIFVEICRLMHSSTYIIIVRVFVYLKDKIDELALMSRSREDYVSRKLKQRR